MFGGFFSCEDLHFTLRDLYASSFSVFIIRYSIFGEIPDYFSFHHGRHAAHFDVLQ